MTRGFQVSFMSVWGWDVTLNVKARLLIPSPNSTTLYYVHLLCCIAPFPNLPTHIFLLDQFCISYRPVGNYTSKFFYIVPAKLKFKNHFPWDLRKVEMTIKWHHLKCTLSVLLIKQLFTKPLSKPVSVNPFFGSILKENQMITCDIFF